MKMKKTFLILTIALLSFAATYVIAQSVNGQNWVGYVKIPAPPAGDLKLIGVNFEAVGSENGGIPLNELLNTNSLVGDDRRISRRDVVYVWDKDTQEYEFYSYYAGDFYRDGVVSNVVMFAGDAVWFQSSSLAPADRDVYALGQVNLASNTPVVYNPGLQLSSYPYPADMVFTNIDWFAEGASGSRRASRADQVYFFNGVDYEAYYLDENGDWTDGSDVYSLELEPAKGFWYYAQAQYEINFERPFGVD